MERFQGPKRAPQTTQDRPKKAPRSSWIVFFALDFSLRFWIVFGSILVPIWPPKCPPKGAHELLVRPLGGVQDGLEIVLVRFSCRLVVRDRFFGRLGVVFGRSRGRFGVFFSLSNRRFNPSTHQPIDSTHQHINSSIQPINPSTRQFNPSTHQLIDSTHLLINTWPFGTF